MGSAGWAWQTRCCALGSEGGSVYPHLMGRVGLCLPSTPPAGGFWGHKAILGGVSWVALSEEPRSPGQSQRQCPRGYPQGSGPKNSWANETPMSAPDPRASACPSCPSLHPGLGTGPGTGGGPSPWKMRWVEETAQGLPVAWVQLYLQPQG